MFTEEVEESIKRHDDVEDCLVVGLPDERLGNRVVAVYRKSQGPHPLVKTVCVNMFGRNSPGIKPLNRPFVVDVVQRAPNGKADYKWAKATAEAHQ